LAIEIELDSLTLQNFQDLKDAHLKKFETAS
jgi:hypothetical protein